MTLPRLPLKDSPETLVLRAVIRVLKTDPVLMSAVKSWCVWDGSSNDAADRTKAGYPHVSIVPQPGETGWQEESMHRSHLTVAIETFVAGTNADDMLNLWSAIRQAIFPALGSTRRAEVVAVMGPIAVNGELIQQPYQFADPSGSAENQVSYGRGELSVKIHVNT